MFSLNQRGKRKRETLKNTKPSSQRNQMEKMNATDYNPFLLDK